MGLQAFYAFIFFYISSVSQSCIPMVLTLRRLDRFCVPVSKPIPVFKTRQNHSTLQKSIPNMSRNRYTPLPRSGSPSSKPPYISFSRDWDANTPICEQAKHLIAAFISQSPRGIRSVPNLLKEQRECRDASPQGTVMYLFHNAIVSELEESFGPTGRGTFNPRSKL